MEIPFVGKIFKKLLSKFEFKRELHKRSRGYIRWYSGWKRNATYKGKPLTRSMIRRVGSKENALKLGLIK